VKDERMRELVFDEGNRALARGADEAGVSRRCQRCGTVHADRGSTLETGKPDTSTDHAPFALIPNNARLGRRLAGRQRSGPNSFGSSIARRSDGNLCRRAADREFLPTLSAAVPIAFLVDAAHLRQPHDDIAVAPRTCLGRSEVQRSVSWRGIWQTRRHGGHPVLRTLTNR
jgi:hypothetical protein